MLKKGKSPSTKIARKKSPGEPVTSETVGRNVRLTAKNWSDFLEYLAAGTPPADAATRARISLSAVFQRRRKDKDFAAKYKEADDQFTDFLEAHAQRLAANCFSDKPTMLIFMLNARRPDIYRPQIGVHGKVVHTFATEFAQAMKNVHDGISSDTRH